MTSSSSFRAGLGALIAAGAFGLAAACSSSSTDATAAPPVTTNDSASPTEGGPSEAGATCTSESLAVARSPVAIDPPRDHHSTMIRETSSGPYLYVFGGAKDDFDTVHSDVQRAKIGADGSLGPFEMASTLKGGRAGTSLAFVPDKKLVVLAGGVQLTTSPPIVKETIYATLGDDGVIGEWKQGPTLPKGVMHAASVVNGDDVYVFGGTTGSSPTTISVRTHVGPDGTLSPYENVTPLSPARSHQAAFVYRGSIYLVGGLTGNPAANPPSRNDVIRAEIQPDGSLGPWIDAGTLPNGVSVSAAQVRGCDVYILGGLSSTHDIFSDAIIRGTIGDDGTMTTETIATKLSIQRGHVHQTPIYGDHMYSVAGRTNDITDAGHFGTTGVVDIGTFAKE